MKKKNRELDETVGYGQKKIFFFALFISPSISKINCSNLEENKNKNNSIHVVVFVDD